jgi:multiple sugar transport system substrate-binding protein
MKHDITRRDALGLGLSAAALAATGAAAQTASTIKAADVPAPSLPIEKGASLRMLRPVRFVKADEDVFRANAAKFTEKMGIEVKVDFVGWEDINQQTAVTSNGGAGPDVIIGFTDAPHIYADKLIELTDVADYLGKRYGGWMFLAEKYGKRHKSNAWIGLPFGAASGPLVYRKSIVQAAGFDKVPDDHAGVLDLYRKLQKAGKPAGFALGNAVGDGNGFANWLLWSHNAALLDEEGNVIINSKETVAALKYLKELYPTFICRDAFLERRQQQPRLLVAGNFADRERRIALLFAEERPGNGGDRGRYRTPVPAERPREELTNGRADAERDGVQAQSLSQCRQGVPAVHDGARTVRAVA